MKSSLKNGRRVQTEVRDIKKEFDRQIGLKNSRETEMIYYHSPDRLRARQKEKQVLAEYDARKIRLTEKRFTRSPRVLQGNRQNILRRP